MSPVCISRIATATPPHDVHAAFVAYASSVMQDRHARSLLKVMGRRSGIEHRYSFLQAEGELAPNSLDGRDLFKTGSFPSTAKRMEYFETFAPLLMRCALNRLALTLEANPGVALIHKPYRKIELARKIRAVLGTPTNTAKQDLLRKLR